MGDAMFVHLDAGRTWGEGGESMFVAALHELGHVLGLGHSMDDRSVMARDGRLESIQWMDWAGIHSLYRNESETSGSLRIQQQHADGSWTSSCVLERVAPPDITDWSLFDTDADGDDELLVWRNDGIGHDHLMIYAFEPSANGQGARLARTHGPLLHAARGGDVHLDDLGAGERFLVVRGTNSEEGRIRVRQFNESGGLTQPDPRRTLERELTYLAHDAPPIRIPKGDVDGDGVIDRVQ